MKCIIKITCCIIAIAFFISCKKVHQSPTVPLDHKPPVTASYFFKNTEWVGTFHAISEQYDGPCCLRFKGDTAVVIYSLFTFLLKGSLVHADSVQGKISKIDSLADGRTTISLSFTLTGEQQTLYITNKKTLAGVTDPMTINSFLPNLQLCPATIASVKGTKWSGKIMTGGNTDGLYAYPDLSQVFFGDQYEEFMRGGTIITYTPSDKLLPVQWEYKQDGSMVFFEGFDETKNKLYSYFGVVLPAGDTMLVDAWPIDQSIFGYGTPRLPNYLQTIYWYGPAGVTPIIYKL